MTEELIQFDKALDRSGDLTVEVANALHELELHAPTSGMKQALAAAKFDAVRLGLMLEGLRAELAKMTRDQPRGMRLHLDYSDPNPQSHVLGSRPCCASPQALGKL